MVGKEEQQLKDGVSPKGKASMKGGRSNKCLKVPMGSYEGADPPLWVHPGDVFMQVHDAISLSSFE